ncbi:MAG TPA: DNA/RNA non-specific endonuclease [Verrucomicrobiae bacterium]|nr:DNA/RNA non-specific endonuclease [Verrucomicrobiae bacterium]
MKTLVILFFTATFCLGTFAADRCDCDAEVRPRIDSYDALLNLSASKKKSLEKKHFAYGQPVAPAGTTGEHLLHLQEYLIWHDDDLRVPLWVSYKLTRADLNTHRERLECFRRDPRLATNECGTCDDYNEPRFDRGHMIPNSDLERSESAMLNSYFFSNMTPQYSNFNRGIWQRLEGMVRDWVRERGTLTVITGAVFDKDDNQARDADGDADRVAPLNRVAIPTHYYKIVVKKKNSGPEAIAILLPHNNSKQPNGQYRAYLTEHITTIDQIEALTGIDFFPTLATSRETVLESGRAAALWPTN